MYNHELPTNPEAEKKLWTAEEVNRAFSQQGSLVGKILVGFPAYKFQEWTAGSLGYVYHFIESDRYIQEFTNHFLRSVSNAQRKEDLIEEATRYIVDNISWVNETPKEGEAVEAAEIIKRKKGSCVGKSFLLAYLLKRLGLSVYQVEGYAQNADVTDCAELKQRNKAYKKYSKFSNNLFNLPLDDKTPIEQDVGHIWVGTQVEGGMIYADPTTGLVSTRPEEKKIYRDHFKPLVGSLFAQGPGRGEKQDACYHDLCFDQPAVRVEVNVIGTLLQPLEGAMVNTYQGMEIESKVPILGFEDIVKKD